jgi:hypothetical protein
MFRTDSSLSAGSLLGFRLAWFESSLADFSQTRLKRAFAVEFVARPTDERVTRASRNMRSLRGHAAGINVPSVRSKLKCPLFVARELSGCG